MCWLCSFRVLYATIQVNRAVFDSVNPSIQRADLNPDSRIQRIQLWGGFTGKTGSAQQKMEHMRFLLMNAVFSFCWILHVQSISKFASNAHNVCNVFDVVLSVVKIVCWCRMSSRLPSTVTSLPTTPTNPDHSICQWIQIRPHCETESRFGQIEYGLNI